MRIYIAASWKHQHAVEMLTERLADDGHDVVSFVAEARRVEGENILAARDVEEWIVSPEGERRFRYDLDGACRSDVVIYLGPSGTDAWAEVGAAYACGVPILGLWAKGEQSGLMRRMMTRWFTDFREMLSYLAQGGDHAR